MLKVKTFTFNLRVSYYCEHKQIRTKTFTSVHIYITKCNWSRNELKYNTNYSKGLKTIKIF